MVDPAKSDDVLDREAAAARHDLRPDEISDAVKKKLLRAQVTGTGRGARYRFPVTWLDEDVSRTRCRICGRLGCRQGRGCRIAAAKRGAPLVQRDDEELTVQQVSALAGISPTALRAGAKRGVLRYKLRRRSGRQPPATTFLRSEVLEDLASLECQCKYPGCANPAPGHSGRCGQHAAKVKEPSVALVCQNPTCPRDGEPFVRPRSWLAEREGRGRYCSNRCKGQATNDADTLRARSAVGAQLAREHQKRVDEMAASLGMTTATLAAALYTSPSVVRATAPA